MRLFAALFLAVLAHSVALAQVFEEDARVDIIRADTYGRVIVSFPDRQLLPKLRTRITNGVFVVLFADPANVDVNRVPVDLSDYVTVARTDPDGKGLRFALNQGVKVNTIEAGEKLFIDFLPRNWQGMPPNLPPEVIAELARRAERAARELKAAEELRKDQAKGAEITVEVGENPTFTRFVFRWNVPFTNSFEHEEDTVTLTFDHGAEPDLSEIRAVPPAELKDIRATIEDGKLQISMMLAPKVDVRAFRDEDAYVVDLTPLAAVVEDPDVARLKKAASSDLVQERQTDLPITSVTGRDVDDGKVVVNDDQPSRGNPEATGGQDLGKAAFVRAEANRIGDTIRLSFPFDRPVGAAVFSRNKSLWMVFDTAVPVDSRPIRAVLDKMAEAIDIRRAGSMTVIRIDLVDQKLTTIGADGSTWVVTIGEMLLEPSKPLTITRAIQTNGNSVLKVDLENYAEIHQIDDPVVGDRIHVVTAYGPPRGLLKPQRFAELETLPSAQGIAAVGYSDDFSVFGETPNRIVMGRTSKGLSLSKAARIREFDLGLAAPETGGRRVGFIDLTDQATTTPEFHDHLEQLREDLIEADPKERSQLRRRLARFYINQAMPFEALAMLRAMEAEDLELQTDSAHHIMQAAAETLAGRTDEALEILDRKEFETNPDAALWRTIAAGQKRDWAAARAAAPIARAAIGDYPLNLQTRYNLAVAESAIEYKDYGGAEAALAEIASGPVGRDLMAEYDLLRGRIADAEGRSEEALARFDRAAELKSGRPSIEAEYMALRLRHRDGLMPPEKILERLDQLATLWRGDETELKVLRFLSQLRVAEGDYRKAFEAMKSAVHAAPNADTARLIHEEMTSVFASLFLEDKADEMKPIDALSLYYDFREMTPIGRQGDEMVRRLAARLVDIDLLDQAASLLQHQVDHRLKGAARAQIAADLASVYLKADKPERALAVLSKTRQTHLPVRLDRQRKLVEARAMSETGRVDRAIDLIRNMDGADVGRLRADIYWNAERWQDAGESLERLHGSRWSDPLPLTDEERVDILKAAIAYSRADDQIGLDRLNSKYVKKMSDSSHAQAFAIVTKPINARGVDFLDVARRVAATDSADAFLKEYREQYMEEAIVGEDGLPPPEAPAPGAENAPAAPAETEAG
ncbi:tetratricopeptide repeat protein [Rhodobium gokarnense]|uniref:Negative regulator of RcsB-dependent stress response n=1 Tax=Rhodobium gokarnense TaxID=364296 RepID=A0ABT3HD71_9HYPH|nr:tetratricopeptide repeat protein [Rhodobium gokarnense]MCW2308332.1 putative negative regulator of RcsB-dependent stress response [Rhodobium gokarnense]